MDNNSLIKTKEQVEQELQNPLYKACNIDYWLQGNNEEYLNNSNALRLYEEKYQEISGLLALYVNMVVRDTKMLKDINNNYLSLDREMQALFDSLGSETE